MAGYATPSWTNGGAPPLSASNLTALGEAVELAEHAFGVCDTAASTAAKTVTVDFSGTLSLFAGLTVKVKFTYANEAANPTLSVNSTAAAPINLNGAAASSGAWNAGEVLILTFDGTNWNGSKGGGGTKKYQHNIYNFYVSGSGMTGTASCVGLSIINDVSTPYTTLSDLTNAIKAIAGTDKPYPASGFGTYYGTSSTYTIDNIGVKSSDDLLYWGGGGYLFSQSQKVQSSAIYDTVVEI